MPGSYPLALYHGDSYAWQFRIWSDAGHTLPVDLVGATAKAEIRYSPGGTEILTLTCTITGPNIIDVHLPAAAWVAFPFKKTGAPSWDLQVTFPGGDVVTYLAGAVTISADVTDSTVPVTAVTS